MAVHYTQTLSVDMIMTEVEALLDWRHDVMRQCFFPAAPSARPADAYAPSALLMWCKKGGESNTVERATVERLSMMHDELRKVAQQLLDNRAAGAAPAVELYDAFETQFSGYVAEVRRLHQEVSGSGMAVDAVTGLRTPAGLKADVQREQDRFDRKGTSYSIANIEIDGMAGLLQTHDRRTLDAVYAAVAQVVSRTIRSFDDAYFMGRGEYLLILKHIDFLDACTVMDRLRGDISMTPVFLPGGDKLRITASFGIAEGIQRESPDVALQNARTALDDAKAQGGNRVREFREQSVLEQYARDVGGTGGSTSF